MRIIREEPFAAFLILVTVIVVSGSVYELRDHIPIGRGNEKVQFVQKRLDYFSYGKYSDVAKCLAEMQKEVSQDPALLLSRLSFPFSLHDSGEVSQTFENISEARKNIDVIITKDVITSLLNQNPEDLFINYQGIMIGDGRIWFVTDKFKKAHIIAINPTKVK